MTGFNLPPGCTISDIERTCGSDPSPPAEKFVKEFEPILDELKAMRFRRVRTLAIALESLKDTTIRRIDDLSEQLIEAQQLLRSALAKLPEDRPCRCDEYFCPRHSETAGEPTLREEMIDFIDRQPKVII